MRYSDAGRDEGFVDGAAAVAGAGEPYSRSFAGVGRRREGVSLWSDVVADMSGGAVDMIDNTSAREWRRYNRGLANGDGIAEDLGKSDLRAVAALGFVKLLQSMTTRTLTTLPRKEFRRPHVFKKLCCEWVYSVYGV